MVSAVVLWAAAAARAAAPTFEPPVVLSDTPTNDVHTIHQVPVAATNGTGTWVVAWDSRDTLHGQVNKDGDILFLRSTDGGLTFTDAAPLNTNAYDDTRYFFNVVDGETDQRPAIAAHGNRFIAVWQRYADNANTIALARSDDGGATWSDPSTLYDRSYHAPSIASDGAGSWVIVWSYRPFGQSEEIFFTRSTDDGLHWSAPSPLDTTPQLNVWRGLYPRVVWSSGVWGVVWTELEPGLTDMARVFFARSLDGSTWSAPFDLHPTSALQTDREPALAGSGDGSWVATWSTGSVNQSGIADILTARSADGGLTWTAPAILNTDAATDGRDDNGVAVAAVAPGTYAAAWVRQGREPGMRFDNQEVFTATSTDHGATWSAPTRMGFPTAGLENQISTSPSLTADGAGRLLALWISNDVRLTSNTKADDLDVVLSFAGQTCGDGMLDAGEACDDGDRGSLDCCGRACGFDAAGAVCAADAEPCTLERCDGAGTCNHEAAPIDTPCAPDADVCTNDRCDGNFACEHVYRPRATCAVSTRPRSSLLAIKGGADPAKRKIAWSWKYGPARNVSTLAGPLYVDGYSLCVYDASGLVARLDAPLDASCDGASCWRGSSNTVLTYVDRAATPTGARSVQLRPGVEGKTSAKASGRGPNVFAPALPTAGGAVHAQLVSDYRNACFGATYSAAGIAQSSASTFKAKSD